MDKNRKNWFSLFLAMTMLASFPAQAAGTDTHLVSQYLQPDIPEGVKAAPVYGAAFLHQEPETGRADQSETQGQTEMQNQPETQGQAETAGQPETQGWSEPDKEAETETEPAWQEPQIVEITEIIDKTEETETVIQDGMIVKRMDEGEIPEIRLLPGQEKPDVEFQDGEADGDADMEGLRITPEELKESFRFETVEREYAAAKEDLLILTDKDTSAEAAGRLCKDGLCYILLTEDLWCYVESGRARGFVEKEKLLTGDEAREFVFERKLVNMQEAEALLSPAENPAFTYTKTTVYDTVAKRVPGIAQYDELNVREGRSTEDRIIGVIPKGGLCYILADARQEWCYVESKDVRGFVLTELLLTGKEARAAVKEAGLEQMELANEQIPPEENRALYYTLKSTSKAYGSKGKYLGKFKLTAYCACAVCCGEYANGITASGTTPIQGRTVAMYGVPFGTKLVVGNQIYTVEDRGTPYGHIDIYMVSHEDAAAFGVKQAEVYLAE